MEGQEFSSMLCKVGRKASHYLNKHESTKTSGELLSYLSFKWIMVYKSGFPHLAINFTFPPSIGTLDIDLHQVAHLQREFPCISGAEIISCQCNAKHSRGQNWGRRGQKQVVIKTIKRVRHQCFHKTCQVGQNMWWCNKMIGDVGTNGIASCTDIFTHKMWIQIHFSQQLLESTHTLQRELKQTQGEETEMARGGNE